MMYGYTPTTAEVRYVYKFGAMPEMDDRPRVVAEMELEFDRWLAEHDREVEARGLEKAADDMHKSWQRGLIASEREWLHARAQQVREGN